MQLEETQGFGSAVSKVLLVVGAIERGTQGALLLGARIRQTSSPGGRQAGLAAVERRRPGRGRQQARLLWLLRARESRRVGRQDSIQQKSSPPPYSVKRIS